MQHEKVLGKVFGATAVHAVAAPAAFAGFAGKWKNQYGSVAEFTVTGSDVTGTYTSAVSSGGGSISGPIVGHTTGDIISFAVLWPSAKPSITTWAGQVIDDNGSEVLKTLWYLVTDIQDASEPTGLWAATYAGADEFTRI
jgi:hypothetical protein